MGRCACALRGFVVWGVCRVGIIDLGGVVSMMVKSGVVVSGMPMSWSLVVMVVMRHNAVHLN
ncbi:MAG: hypothetical protein ACR2HJ_08495 [Fimbriimonadales bacterium]